MNSIAVIVQIVLVILKACMVEPFGSMAWTDPLLWIPLMVIGTIIGLYIICTLGAIILSAFASKE